MKYFIVLIDFISESSRARLLNGIRRFMNDDKIIELLFDKDERGLEVIKQKYSALYKGILRQTLSDENDVKECENDLLLAVWNSIPPQNPRSLKAYICVIARRLGVDRYRYNSRQKRGNGYTLLLSEIGDCIPDNNSVDFSETDEENQKVKSVLDNFLKGLDKKTRVLFVHRYFLFYSVYDIAEKFNLKENYISVRLFRAKNKLKKLLKKENIYL